MFICKKKGRYCNCLIINLIGYILSLKYKIKCSYINPNDYQNIGIYFNNSPIINKKNIYLDNKKVEFLLYNKVNLNINFNYILDDYFQNVNISKYLCNYITNLNNDISKSIIQNNKYKDNYNNNNDLFIHIRIGDVYDNKLVIPGIEYYKFIINKCKADNIYLSSDSINNTLIKNLKHLFDIKIIDYDLYDCILFGSTCKYICMSSGSFSYNIGLFGFHSKNIFFHKSNGFVFIKDNKYKRWYPNFYDGLVINNKYIKI